MNIGNLIFGHNSDTVSYLIYCHSLLQNATDIVIKLQDTKKFITKCKMRQVFFITKCDRYYKMRRLLQIATEQRFKALYQNYVRQVHLNSNERISGEPVFGSYST